MRGAGGVSWNRSCVCVLTLSHHRNWSAGLKTSEGTVPPFYAFAPQEQRTLSVLTIIITGTF